MKARLPINKKMRKQIRECAVRDVQEHIDRSNRKASEVFILASACVLHIDNGFGKVRLMRFMNALMEFYNQLDGYDDAAAFKCIQILEDTGMDMEWWKSQMR